MGHYVTSQAIQNVHYRTTDNTPYESYSNHEIENTQTICADQLVRPGSRQACRDKAEAGSVRRTSLDTPAETLVMRDKQLQVSGLAARGDREALPARPTSARLSILWRGP